jgi:antitoxin (DNA-binding transcriptional repressor) of toxin-antitoxin stability system
MHTVAIRDLKNNPSNITKHLENNETVFITKHGKPVGITLPLNDDTFSMEIKKLVALEQYREGLISLAKMASLLEIDKEEARRLVERVGIDWLEVDEEELGRQSEVARKVAGR